MHRHSAVERAANTVLCTRRMGSRRLRWQGDRKTEQEQPSDIHPATWPVQVTMPPPQRVHGHWTQLTPWLQWTSRPWLVLWVLPACEPPGSSLGFRDSHLPATISGFFEPGNPRPEALLDFLCLSKTCQAGYAAFLPLSFPDTSKMPRYQEANEE